jgi:glycosyltransferase involved in cell wall biosynthesis
MERNGKLNLERPLRIAQLAPLFESVPPKLYGGTERVVSYITEELVRRGHDVTLFASGDSETAAALVPGCEQGLRIRGHSDLGTAMQMAMAAEAYKAARERFDIVHSHIGYWSLPFARITGVPTVATMHGRLDDRELRPIFERFDDIPLVSISDAQRRPLPGMNWCATVSHGLPPKLLGFSPKPRGYLAFIGRISPEKRPDLAIQISLKSGVPLKIAAKVDTPDRNYFEAVVKPLIQPPHIEYVGEINDREKNEFLGGAVALMFPIDWPEPFGLAMIEALACGTPVIARPCGSVPEIIRNGVTGFYSNDVNELVDAVRQVETISRKRCREEFDRRFTSEKMVENYERVYRRIIDGHQLKRSVPAETRLLAQTQL